MFEVNGIKFDSYLEAVKHALPINAKVIGYNKKGKGSYLKVSTKAARYYEERLAAYDAYKALNAK